MRDLKVYTLSDWPRRKNGELIFQTTNEAIYYANLTDNRLGAYDQLKKWRRNAQYEVTRLKAIKSNNYDRMFECAVRAQFYRECMEEIKRLNEEEL